MFDHLKIDFNAEAKDSIVRLHGLGHTVVIVANAVVVIVATVVIVASAVMTVVIVANAANATTGTETGKEPNYGQQTVLPPPQSLPVLGR